MKKNTDILNGSLFKNIFLFALPIAVSSVLQQLFNAADTAIAGQFGSHDALAAVGTNGEIAALIVSLSAGLSVGANVLIARYVGKDEKDKIGNAITSSLFISIVSGIIITAIGIVAAEPLLILIKTPSDILNSAAEYLKVYLLGVPFLLIYDFGAAILRAKGDSKRPLYALMLSGAINVLLNLFFVIVCNLNVVGVALATDISTAISAFIVLILLSREKGEFRLQFKFCKPERSHLLTILKIGVPAALQGAVFCVANIFVQSAVNQFGSDTVAGSAIAMNYEYITYYIITAFGQAATTFISQNYAAKNYDRCRKIVPVCIMYAFLCCAAITTPVSVFCSGASSLFSSSDSVIENSCLRILLILLFEPICAFFEIPASAMRGYGVSTLPAVQIIAGICLFRIAWIFTVFNHFQTLQSLYIAFPISWVITSVIIVITFFAVKRKKLRT